MTYSRLRSFSFLTRSVGSLLTRSMYSTYPCYNAKCPSLSSFYILSQTVSSQIGFARLLSRGIRTVGCVLSADKSPGKRDEGVKQPGSGDIKSPVNRDEGEKPVTDSFDEEDSERLGKDLQRPRSLRLMEMAEMMWPSPFKAIRNAFFILLIRGYFDQDFSKASFLDGVEQAVAHVSSLISRGQFEGLEGLVTKEAIHEIKKNYLNLTTNQKEFVCVNPTDFFFRFIYEIGIIFDDSNNKRFVEITTVLQGFHGLAAAKAKNADHYVNELMQSKENMFVCNYRFIREYTKGKEDTWTVNQLNHFSPAELARSKGPFDR